MGKQKSVKKVIKQGIRHIAARFGPHTREHKSPRLVILMYHRVLPAGDERALIEEPGMLVTPESLALQLEILKKQFSVIGLSEWLHRKSSNIPLPSISFAITFDDGWADNYEFAFPVLQKLSIPATIFLVSGNIGTDHVFWPERLARLIKTVTRTQSDKLSHPSLDWLHNVCERRPITATEPGPDDLSRIIACAKILPDLEIQALLDSSEQALGLNNAGHKPLLLDWEQLSVMTESGLVEAGSHTCHHIRLNSQTPENVIKTEISDSKEMIEERTGHPVKLFCYPNGDYSPTALDLVRNSYTGAVTTESGWNSTSTDNHLLRRIGIHEDIAGTETAFLARISGWV